MQLNYFGVLDTAEAPSHSAFVHAKLEIKQKVSECIPKSTVVFAQPSSIVCVCVCACVHKCVRAGSWHISCCVSDQKLFKAVAIKCLPDTWSNTDLSLNICWMKEGKWPGPSDSLGLKKSSQFFFSTQNSAAHTKILRKRSQNGRDHKL